MKTLNRWKVGFAKSVLLVVAVAMQAQDTDQLNLLKQQLERLQANFDRVTREQQAEIEALKTQIAALENAARPAVVATESNAVARPLVPMQTETSWSPSDPIHVGKGSAYAEIGLVATFAVGGSTAEDIEGGTQLGGHDPNQRGFTVQGAELNLQGAVDPFFRGNANILFSVDADGESFVELEEAWLQTVTLPANLQVRAGEVLTEFGRVNTQHPHSWGFVDTPLVNGRFLGADGLRNPGARISWLAPTPFYSELFLGIQNSHGETASSFRSTGQGHEGAGQERLPFGYRHAVNDRGIDGLSDLLFTPRYAMAFDLTDNQTFVAGASAAFGPNASGSAGHTDTQIYGLDLYWKWKSPRAHAGFPFVSWQSEAMLRRYELGSFDWQEVADAGEMPIIDTATMLPAVLHRETVTDYGFYSEVLYGFKKGWVAGLRLDYVTDETGDYERASLTFAGEPLGRDPQRNQRWRISPNLTWYPSEFSKLRLQYNYDERRDIGADHSLWLQFEFILGAHAAHKF